MFYLNSKITSTNGQLCEIALISLYNSFLQTKSQNSLAIQSIRSSSQEFTQSKLNFHPDELTLNCLSLVERCTQIVGSSNHKSMPRAAAVAEVRRRRRTGTNTTAE